MISHHLIIIHGVRDLLNINTLILRKQKNYSLIFFLANQIYNPTTLPAGGQFFDDQTYESYRQHYSRMSVANFQQQRNEQQLLLLSLGKKRSLKERNKKIVPHLYLSYLANSQSPVQPIQSLPNHIPNHQSQPSTCLPPRSTLDDDEQQLLNAIHAHPNKRDLVLNLLRQMNQSPSLAASTIHNQQQQNNPYYNHHQQ